MSNGVIFTDAAAQRIVDATRWTENNKGRNLPPGNGSPVGRRNIGRHPLRIVKTTETISPNSFGGFKFTTGAKGSETVTGDEYQGFYRASDSTDPPDLPSGTTCYAIWVPCDSLTGDQTGWELTPVACIEEA